MANGGKLINFAICGVLILAMNEFQIGNAQNAALEAPILATQSEYDRTTPLAVGSEEWRRRVEEINRKYDEDQRRRQKDAEESYARSKIERHELEQRAIEDERRTEKRIHRIIDNYALGHHRKHSRLMNANELVECTRRTSYQDRTENFYCRDGKVCCDNGCCESSWQIFKRYSYIWIVLALVVVSLCGGVIVTVIRRKKGTATVTTVNAPNAGSGVPPPAIQLPVLQHPDNYRLPRPTDDPASFLLSTSHPAHQSGSRNQSGRSTSVNSAYQDMPTGGTASNAPPSYFDAVHKGVGQRTHTPTMG